MSWSSIFFNLFHGGPWANVFIFYSVLNFSEGFLDSGVAGKIFYDVLAWIAPSEHLELANNFILSYMSFLSLAPKNEICCLLEI